MKFGKTLLKIIGFMLMVIGAGLAIYGAWDSIAAWFQKLTTRKSRREEMKDYADCIFY